MADIISIDTFLLSGDVTEAYCAGSADGASAAADDPPPGSADQAPSVTSSNGASWLPIVDVSKSEKTEKEEEPQEDGQAPGSDEDTTGEGDAAPDDAEGDGGSDGEGDADSASEGGDENTEGSDKGDDAADNEENAEGGEDGEKGEDSEKGEKGEDSEGDEAEGEEEVNPEASTEEPVNEEPKTEAITTAAAPAAAPADSGTSGLLITIIIVMGALILGLIVLLIVKSVKSKRPAYTPITMQVPPQPGMQTQAPGMMNMPGMMQQMPAAPPSIYRVGKVHEQGARGEQQDSFGISNVELVPEYGLLAVVADGMGGLEDGGRVSAAATRSVLNTFLMTQGRFTSKELLITLLRQAETDVNEALGEENYRKSGTTIVMGYFRGEEFNFLSVGDSRISLYRNGMLMQLNREHTYENKQLVRSVNGEITVGDALTDPKGSGLVNFLGKGEISALDMPASPVKLVQGDKVILMSDGVYNALTEEELTAALAGTSEQAAEAIHAAVAAKNYSNQDNYTAVIIGYGV